MKLTQIDHNKLDNDLIKRIFFNIKKEKYEYADYIVIYGCHIKELLDERLKYALKVINSNNYGSVLITGGVGVYGDFNESEYMKKYLIDNGIDENKIIVEDESTTTEENNLNIMNMLKLNEIDENTNIALITHEFHMLRLILHWSKILNNDNINFYYDYVENSILSYDKMIEDDKLIKTLSQQLEKTKRFIKAGYYIDKNIEDVKK